MSDTKKRVSDVEFVTACRDGVPCRDVAALLQRAEAAVRARAAKLRELGVKLPAFPRAVRKPKVVDVAGLNEII